MHARKKIVIAIAVLSSLLFLSCRQVPPPLSGLWTGEVQLTDTSYIATLGVWFIVTEGGQSVITLNIGNQEIKGTFKIENREFVATHYESGMGFVGADGMIAGEWERQRAEQVGATVYGKFNTESKVSGVLRGVRLKIGGGRIQSFDTELKWHAELNQK